MNIPQEYSQVSSIKQLIIHGVGDSIFIFLRFVSIRNNFQRSVQFFNLLEIPND